jgi:hypothetical protein
MRLKVPHIELKRFVSANTLPLLAPAVVPCIPASPVALRPDLPDFIVAAMVTLCNAIGPLRCEPMRCAATQEVFCRGRRRNGYLVVYCGQPPPIRLHNAHVIDHMSKLKPDMPVSIKVRVVRNV